MQEAKENRPNSELIDYKKALRMINPNPEIENATEKPWMLIQNVDTLSKVDQTSLRSGMSKTIYSQAGQ